MVTARAIALLRQQHAQILELLTGDETRLETLDDREALRHFVTSLEERVRDHFCLQQAALFPVLVRHPCVARWPLPLLQAERVTIRRLLANRTWIQTHAPLSSERVHLSSIVDLLLLHLVKEDLVLFPLALGILADEEHGEIDSRADAIGYGRHGAECLAQ
jgi:hypothetical protein